MKFADRGEAGRRLAGLLQHLKDRRPVVLALPRGGVAIGLEVARALDAPLDVVLVRKIGAPWQPELAIGAVTDGGEPETFIDRDMVAGLGVPETYIAEETARQVTEVERRRRLYCRDRPPLDVAGRTAIVVDDGIATGATMRVALRAVRRRNPERLVLAVPVAAPSSLAALRPEADEMVCVETPAGLGAIGFYYVDFHQMSDVEVTEMLAAGPPAPSVPAQPEGSEVEHEETGPGWNVVVTLPEATLGEARRFLRRWGTVRRTSHFRVLVLSVADPQRFLEEFAEAAEARPGIFNFLSHVIPAQRTFAFADAAAFEAKAREIGLGWVPRLAGKSFHVRLHRRGMKGALSTPSEERFLDDALLDALKAAGTPGRIAFADPDAVIQIETVDRQAGMSLWEREALRRYPFLGVS